MDLLGIFCKYACSFNGGKGKGVDGGVHGTPKEGWPPLAKWTFGDLEVFEVTSVDERFGGCNSYTDRTELQGAVGLRDRRPCFPIGHSNMSLTIRGIPPSIMSLHARRVRFPRANFLQHLCRRKVG